MIIRTAISIFLILIFIFTIPLKALADKTGFTVYVSFGIVIGGLTIFISYGSREALPGAVTSTNHNGDFYDASFVTGPYNDSVPSTPQGQPLFFPSHPLLRLLSW